MSESRWSLTEEHARAITSRRGLNSGLCQKLGMHTHDAKTIGFHYLKNGEIYNTHLRKAGKEMPWVIPAKDKPLIFWNIDCLKTVEAGDRIVITEGEFDGIACVQAGFERTVSVPNGAPQSNREEGSRYGYLLAGKELIPELRDAIAKGCRITLAVDGDEKGRWLRDDLAVRIGDEHCSWVEWPEGCKDANDALQRHGEAELRSAILSARPMWNDELGSLDDFTRRQSVSYPTGIPDFGLKIELPSLLLMMGAYHTGKSTFLRQLLWSLWKTHKWRFLLTCLEEPVWPRIVGHFCALEIGRHPANFGWGGKDASEEIARAEAEIRRAARFLVRPKRELLSRKRFFDRVELAVRRDGVRVIGLDPVNELDHDIGPNETLYWANFIMDCKALADEYQLLFIICGHPSKDGYLRLLKSRETKLPQLVDMAGSMNWANKADIGITISKPNPDKPITWLYHEKAKDHETMGKPTLYELTHHPGINRFEITGQGFELVFGDRNDSE